MEVLYMTDRSAAAGKSGTVYSDGRSRRLAFGSAGVSLDPLPTWPEFVKDSTRSQRIRSYALKPGACREMGYLLGAYHSTRLGVGRRPNTGRNTCWSS